MQTQDEIDFLDMLGERSFGLKMWAKSRLDAGSTLQSLHAQLAREVETVRGWLIGRFGGYAG